MSRFLITILNGKTVNFIIDNLLVIAVALVSGAALLFPSFQRRGARMSQMQATQAMNRGKTLVLDVRDPTEFEAGHLNNAKNIPLKDLQTRLTELSKFKTQVVITVCESGVRSSKATTLLGKAGFEQVASLDGGMAAWKSQGLPTVK